MFQVKKFSKPIIIILILSFSLFLHSCDFNKVILKLAVKKLSPQTISTNKFSGVKVNKVISLDTILNTNLPIDLMAGLNPLVPPAVSFNQNFFFAIKDSSCYKLFKYDPRKKLLSCISLIIDPKDFVEDKETKIGKVSRIAINDSYLVIAGENLAFVFVKDNDNSFKYSFGFKLNSPISGMFIKDKILYLIDLRYTNEVKEYAGNRIFQIDLAERKLINIIPIPFENLEFLCYAPNKYWAISPNKEFFLIANPLNLEFLILSTNGFQKLFHIKDTTNSNWIQFKSSYYDSINNVNRQNKMYSRLQPGVFLNKLDKEFFAKNGSKVIFVDFINDTTFWVTYSFGTVKEKEKFGFLCDIWRLNSAENIWNKIASGLIDSPPDSKSKASKSNYYLLSGSFLLSFANEYSASFQLSAPSELMLPKDNVTFDQIFKRRDKFFADKVPLWQFYIYKLNIE